MVIHIIDVCVLYCTVWERIGTGFYCSVNERWAAATPGPPESLRYPRPSKSYWPTLGIPYPAAGQNLMRHRMLPTLVYSSKCEKPNLWVITSQVEIIGLNQINCGPMRQPSKARKPHGAAAKRRTPHDFQMTSFTTLEGGEENRMGRLN